MKKETYGKRYERKTVRHSTGYERKERYRKSGTVYGEKDGKAVYKKIHSNV